MDRIDMRLLERHIKRAKEFTLIMLLIFGLIAGACVIAGWMSDDIEAKNIAICPSDERVVLLKEGDWIEQTHQWGWGKVPKQNNCPHCGKTSYTRFCIDCKKERGNLPFIGVYCPKCNPDGKYASKTDDITVICGDCSSEKTWKYVYEDWQTEPNEPECKHERIIGYSLGYDFSPTYCAVCGVVIETYEPECKHENRITCTVYGCGCWSCMDCDEHSEGVKILKFSRDNMTWSIPTWPQYIELEKDIWIEYPVTEFYQGHKQMYYPKGTKIYFKDKQ